MVIADLAGKLVFLDTAPLIYFIEGGSPHQSVLQNLFNANAAQDFDFVTSAVTLLEVLVKPMRAGNPGIAQQYRDILTNSSTLTLVDITATIAEHAAHFRARYNLRTPDAIQLAAAIEVGADYFLTNDLGLKKVTEIITITLDDLTEVAS